MRTSPHAAKRYFGRLAPTSEEAFSLVELLTVIALLSILAVATVPSLRGTMDGITINGAAGVIEAELSLARQTALSRNLPVEVRIYQHDDGTGVAWRMVALVIPASVTGKAADEWVSRGKVLRGSVVIDDAKEFSTVVSDAKKAGAGVVAPIRSEESASAPPLLREKAYVAFQFKPDGSTNLPNGQPWCLTLRNLNGHPSGNAPAANYVSLVLDSLTGRTIAFQP